MQIVDFIETADLSLQDDGFFLHKMTRVRRSGSSQSRGMARNFARSRDPYLRTLQFRIIHSGNKNNQSNTSFLSERPFNYFDYDRISACHGNI